MAVLNKELASCVFPIIGIVYLLSLGIYRLYFSPIAKFPGPRLAALSFWYEFYHDVVRGGQYEFEIKKMHQIHGPIVRISPSELHVDDPEYIDTLYPSSNALGSAGKVNKWPWVMKMFGSPQSTFGTSPHDLHRRRRASISPFFSKRSVLELEAFIQYYIDKLIKRLKALRGNNNPINLIDCYSSLTGDIICDYSFGRPQGFLDEPSFSPKWRSLILKFGAAGHLMKQFGWLLPLMESLPDGIAQKLNPHLTEIGKLYQLLRLQINEVFQEKSSRASTDMKGPPHRTIFHEILESNLPDTEKSIIRLSQEGQVLMTAGTTTTADTLAITSFHLLQNPDILQRLKLELNSLDSSQQLPATGGSKPRLQQLERLPYLTAIIKEGMRLANGVCHRLQRIHPEAELQYKRWTIPRGTPVSMSSWMIHHNESKFPKSHQFQPERWLSDVKSDNSSLSFPEKVVHERLDKYLFSFGRGTRQCIAINLAWAELYMTIAAMFGPGQLQFELFETDESDIKMARDSFVPQARDSSKGIRILIH